MSFLAERLPPPDVLAAIRAPFEASGGVWTDAPVVQPLNLLLDLAGEALRARLFVVEGEGHEEACLRPDFTIPLALSHLAGGAREGRYLYQGKAFRVAPPGAPTEFWQLGTEIYGGAADLALADAEVMALAWRAAAAGGRDDLGLVMGDVGLFGAFLTALGIPDGARTRMVRAFPAGRSVRAELARVQEPHGGGSQGRLATLLSELPEAEAASVLEELWRLAGIQPVGGRAPSEIVHRLSLRAAGERNARLTAAEAELIARYLDVIEPPRRALDRIERLAYEARIEFDVQLRPWVERLKALAGLDVPEDLITFSTGFVRPFGYYDGVLFEVRSTALGAERPVAAGGRYDGLPARLGAGDDRPTRAVGCMVRPTRAWVGAA